jgi:hypothetical protein
MRLSRTRLEELLQELKAINFWDRHYGCGSEHDFINASAWIARRRRALEIKMEVNEFYGESFDAGKKRGGKHQLGTCDKAGRLFRGYSLAECGTRRRPSSLPLISPLVVHAGVNIPRFLSRDDLHGTSATRACRLMSDVLRTL